MKRYLFVFTIIIVIISGCGSQKDPNTIEMHALTAQGVGERIGTIKISETPYGTLFTPNLTGLEPGLHGFHLHETGNCDAAEKDGKMVPGLAAGGHYDPSGTKAHKGPYGEGHPGDLPALYVDDQGRSTLPVLAPRIKTADVKGRALIIHAGGDNYSDRPAALGGGGSRVACGVADK